MALIVREDLNGDVQIVTLPAKLNIQEADELKAIFNQFVQRKKYRWVIDCSQANYIDSNGLAALVSRIAECRFNQGDIRLVSPTKFVQSMLMITHLDQVLKSYEDMQSAIQSF